MCLRMAAGPLAVVAILSILAIAPVGCCSTAANVGTTGLPFTARELAVGETAGPLEVMACKKWNSSGVMAAPGQRFAFAAVGEWRDLYITSDADGIRRPNWLQRTFEDKKRIREARYFELAGEHGQDSGRVFRIGREEDWRTPSGESAEILLFANDVAFAYFNNFGSLMVTIKRKH